MEMLPAGIQAGIAPMQYDAATRHFTVGVKPDAGTPVDASNGDPVRHAVVILKTAE